MNYTHGHAALGILAASGLVFFGATAAISQNSSGNGSAALASGASGASTKALGDSAPNGSLVKTDSNWRGSELVGATVYNDRGADIGTVNDLLVSGDGTVSNAVLSVGGFLGIGSKLVEVPFKNLKFAPSQSNPASGSKMATQGNAPPPASAANSQMNPSTVPAGSGATGTGLGMAAPTPAGTSGTARGAPGTQEFSLVLPGATKQSLTNDPTFTFAD